MSTGWGKKKKYIILDTKIKLNITEQYVEMGFLNVFVCSLT